MIRSRFSIWRLAGVMEVAMDIDCEEMSRLLEASALSPTPSEAHGMLCGVICGGDATPEQTWIDQLLPKTDANAPPLDAARDRLRSLVTQTQADIVSPDLGFSLLLPDESRPLAERATALYDWVRGFLYALGLLGVSERDFSAQTQEVLRDFTDLTRMDLDDLEDSEENESALTDVTEFVWAAALLVHAERAGARDESSQS